MVEHFLIICKKKKKQYVIIENKYSKSSCGIVGWWYIV